MLALTWRITTINKGNTIASELRKHDHLRPAGFKLAPGRTAPLHVTRAGVDSIEAIFMFETAEARGSGVLTKAYAGSEQRRYVESVDLLTALTRLRGTRSGLAGRGP